MNGETAALDRLRAYFGASFALISDQAGMTEAYLQQTERGQLALEAVRAVGLQNDPVIVQLCAALGTLAMGFLERQHWEADAQQMQDAAVAAMIAARGET